MKKNPVKKYSTLVVAAPDFVGRLSGRRVVTSSSAAKKIVSTEVCSSVLAWDIQQMPIEGLSFAGFQTGWQDLRIMAHTSEARTLAWLQDSAIVIGDLYSTKNDPVTFAPRYVLQQQIEQLKKLGLTATVATELEFYLTPTDIAKTVSPNRHDFSVDATTNEMAVLFDELTELLRHSNVIVESWQAEWGLGQWEVNLKKGTPLEVADAHVIFKLAVKEIALRHGFAANFMAKPRSADVGSSCHIHLSLQDATGEQIFYNKKDKLLLSKAAYSAIAGILHYAPESMPLYANTINSYRRLAASEFCGNGATWGVDNRTTSCRILGHSADTLHIEFRIPGADANPYLALAGVLASSRKGITEKRAGLSEYTGDAGSQQFEKYPLTLESATQKFLDSAFIKAEFGREFVSEYGVHLQHEIALFQKSVTDWEVSRYSDII